MIFARRDDDATHLLYLMRSYPSLAISKSSSLLQHSKTDKREARHAAHTAREAGKMRGFGRPPTAHTPLMSVVCATDMTANDLVLVMRTMVDAEDWTDQTDPNMGVTPLMGLSFRPDNEETVKMAQVLLEHGTRVDTRDTSGPGCTALWMCAQNGSSNLLRFLIDRGATIDATPQHSQTQAINIAAQENHAECVAILAQAAVDQNKAILESTSKEGRTAAFIGVERNYPQVVGVLAKAGADLRRACPVYFSIHGNLIDPTPDMEGHHALNQAVRSFVESRCARSDCGEKSLDFLSCSRCRLACYCSKQCQTKDWAAVHKRCCKKLRQGSHMFGDPNVAPRAQFHEPFGFDDPFTSADEIASSDYDRDTHVVWEYDAGRRGRSDWCRYPARIEEKLERMLQHGDGRFMYRPGRPSSDGMHEQTRSPRAPESVATIYVYYCDMIEREVYTGAGRRVRRNGSCRCFNVTELDWRDNM